MAVNGALFSSATDEWETPQELFNELDREFEFTLDVCATKDNRKCSNYYSKAQDGLSKNWHGVCWMNPPYGREIRKWVEKAAYEAWHGATVVCLLPARTDTRWWHDYIWDNENHCPREGVKIRLLKGRLKFGGSKNSAPFPSAIVIFGGDVQRVETLSR